MNLLEETLKRLGINSYDDLKDIEKDTYNQWLTQMSQDVTIDDIRNHIEQMKNAVISELVDEPEFNYFFFGVFKRVNPKNIQLKARLKNYVLLAAFLGTPEQAREALEKHLQQLKPVV